MQILPDLFASNKSWAERIEREAPGFFEELSEDQTPEYLWIGCADSRVPANQIVDLSPGDMFVHRNIANLVLHTDMNCLSVIQYAVEVLHVEHIIVCGHYGCGGVRAALEGKQLGLIENWLRVIQDLATQHRPLLDACTTVSEKVERLCELNAIAQATNMCRTTFVRHAWERGQQLSVHGWIYGLSDGILHDLDFAVSSASEVDEAAASAMARLASC